MRRILSIITLFFITITPVHAADLPTIYSNTMANGGQSWSLPIQTLLTITALGFIPSLLLMMTSFTRIIIILGLLRSALGTPTAPPNQILLGLALFMTFFIMSPVLDDIYQNAYKPFNAETITLEQAIDEGTKPLHQFMLKQTRQTDLALFSNLAKEAEYNSEEDIPMRILVPAFITSELKTAFQIGFILFIPFLIIDLVVASVLMALGMMMVPPATVSLPFKLMLFVMVDGWQLVIGSISQSFFS